MSTDKKVVYQSIDLEAVNNEPRVNAIGLCAMDENGVILKKRRWCIEVEDSAFGIECKEQFWDKHPELLQMIKKEAKPEGEQIKDFVEFYDSVHKDLGIEETQIKMVGDNPEFDYGSMNHLVKKHCNRSPLRYTTKEKYRPIRDIGEATWSLGVGEIIEKKTEELAKHDHNPENDAESICLNHIVGLKVIAEITKQLGDKIKEIAESEATKVVEAMKVARKEQEK
jgi:hypothetical protein